MEDKVEKTSQKQQEKDKRLRKNEEGLRELQEDNMKHNKIHIIGISEREEEDGIEDLFEKVMMENFPNLMREKVTQIQETQRVSIKRNQRRFTPQHNIIKNGKIPRQRKNPKGRKGETGSNIQRSPGKTRS